MFSKQKHFEEIHGLIHLLKNPLMSLLNHYCPDPIANQTYAERQMFKRNYPWLKQIEYAACQVEEKIFKGLALLSLSVLLEDLFHTPIQYYIKTTTPSLWSMKVLLRSFAFVIGQLPSLGHLIGIALAASFGCFFIKQCYTRFYRARKGREFNRLHKGNIEIINKLYSSQNQFCRQIERVRADSLISEGRIQLSQNDRDWIGILNEILDETKHILDDDMRLSVLSLFEQSEDRVSHSGSYARETDLLLRPQEEMSALGLFCRYDSIKRKAIPRAQKILNLQTQIRETMSVLAQSGVDTLHFDLLPSRGSGLITEYRIRRQQATSIMDRVAVQDSILNDVTSQILTIDQAGWLAPSALTYNHSPTP
ncbi:MAG: hypothetical protein VXY77_00370 [Pseudomonadota bacterium]|nr:hypothetical protein [Pseudomonadota bacterium]